MTDAEIDRVAGTVLEVIVKEPGQLNASDVIAAVRTAQIGAPTIRRAIWRLITTGQADLTDELCLRPDVSTR